jgi:hypothetical protein
MSRMRRSVQLLHASRSSLGGRDISNRSTSDDKGRSSHHPRTNVKVWHVRARTYGSLKDKSAMPAFGAERTFHNSRSTNFRC